MYWAQRVKKKDPSVGISTSISAAALERYARSDDSLAGLIEQHCIEVRDFMVLSFVCDQNELTIDQLMRALGLSRHTILDCIERLLAAELVSGAETKEAHKSNSIIRATSIGRRVTRRVHRQQQST